ncbi:MAG: Grx4 family monothiol glutaredoxin [Bacteriovoracaceae bacterium]|jgi:monothiol glutaredoxin|nr:Grx4 family monothiol glutaredoxin [Bacteriovoracaceae bacterium]
MSDKNPFEILGTDKISTPGGTPLQETNTSADLTERITNIIGSANIVLFMKGSPEVPQCGFSANVISILNNMQATYNTFDILSDMDIREGVKQFANWPTYPQLWVKGKLVGGNDIIMELFETKELQEVLDS